MKYKNKEVCLATDAQYAPIFKNGVPFIQVTWPLIDKQIVDLPIDLAKSMLDVTLTDRKFENDLYTPVALSVALRGVMN